MKIVDAKISLASEHYSSKQVHIEESLKFWVEFQTQIEAGKIHPTQIQGSTTDWNRLLSDLKKLLEKYQIEIASVKANEIQVKDLDRIKLQIIERFVKILTGKNLRFKVLRCSDFSTLILPIAFQNNPNQLSQIPNFKLAYQRREISRESEKLLFTAVGTIITADGQRIDFDTQMFVSRELASLSNISAETGKLIDPLVINFNGLAAGITETYFRFDLDVDGIEEMIPFVSEGSGLLALDLNEDQKINDGSELFGAVTGNGFEELPNMTRMVTVGSMKPIRFSTVYGSGLKTLRGRTPFLPWDRKELVPFFSVILTPNLAFEVKRTDWRLNIKKPGSM